MIRINIIGIILCKSLKLVYLEKYINIFISKSLIVEQIFSLTLFINLR